MKLTILLLLITSFFLFFTYQQTPGNQREGQVTKKGFAKEKSSPSTPDSVLNQRKQLQWASNYQEDSMSLEVALKDAFRVATPAFGAESFSSSYTLPTPDSLEDMDIEIVVGKLLGTSTTYFLLRRFHTGTEEVYLNLYKIQGDSSIEVLNYQQDVMVYRQDTIFDVNGDQQQDFVVHWYPSAGSWSREVYTVYLNSNQDSSFTEGYTFINPRFAPTQGLIYGKEYGDPRETPWYNYQWKNLQVDTLAYIYPHPTQEGKYIQVPNKGYLEHLEQGVLLDSLPVEFIGL